MYYRTFFFYINKFKFRWMMVNDYGMSFASFLSQILNPTIHLPYNIHIREYLQDTITRN